MTLAARIGLGHAEWENMTPRELELWASVFVERSRDEAKIRHVENYNLAGLIRTMVWAKHAPSYDSLYPSDARKDMTDEQMYEQVCALSKIFGGTLEEA